MRARPSEHARWPGLSAPRGVAHCQHSHAGRVARDPANVSAGPFKDKVRWGQQGTWAQARPAVIPEFLAVPSCVRLQAPWSYEAPMPVV